MESRLSRPHLIWRIKRHGVCSPHTRRTGERFSNRTQMHMEKGLGLQTNERDRLAELRRIQMDREFTADELAEFKTLSSMETPSATEEERREYVELSRRQTAGTDWTPDDARRAQELLKKLEK